jgi:hypothetical protein
MPRVPPRSTGVGRVVALNRFGSIRRGPNGAYVWSILHDRLTRKAVEVAQDVADETVVTRGLDGGELVVMNPEGELREGPAVLVAK